MSTSREVLETLLADFNEELRATGKANFALREQCPEELRQELTALMNVAVLTKEALAQKFGLPQEHTLKAGRKAS